MDLVYKFTAAELAGIQKRRDEVIRFLNDIAEIREIPGKLAISPKGDGFVKEPENGDT